MNKNSQRTIEHSKSRIPALDFAKGIGIILVAWGHADMKMEPVFYVEKLKFMHNMIFSFHLPLFFIISGALVTRSMDKTDFNARTYIKKTFSNLLLPFLSLNFILGVVNILTPESFYSTPSIKQMILAVFFMQSHVTYLPSGPLWFLFTLYSAAIVTYIAVKILKLDCYSLLMISILMAFASHQYSHVDVLGLRRFLYNYEFFVIGYILSGHVIRKQIETSLLFYLLLLALWLTPFLIKEIYGNLMHLTTGITASFIIIYLSHSLNHSKRNAAYNFIYLCGQNSLLIFAFHMPVYVLMKKLVYTLGLSDTYFGLVLMIASGVGGPLLISKIISFNDMLFRLLFWKRPNRTPISYRMNI